MGKKSASPSTCDTQVLPVLMVESPEQSKPINLKLLSTYLGML